MLTIRDLSNAHSWLREAKTVDADIDIGTDLKTGGLSGRAMLVWARHGLGLDEQARS